MEVDMTHKILYLFIVSFLSILSPCGLKANSFFDDLKEKIDQTAESIKEGLDSVSSNLDDMQEYLDQYPWQGLIKSELNLGHVSVRDFRLDSHPYALAVEAGDQVKGEITCLLNRKKCSPIDFYQVIIGLKNVGPKAVVGDLNYTLKAKGVEEFTFIAPEEPGIYEVRCRLHQSFFTPEAEKMWWDSEGNEPDASHTIGFLIVK
jgi:hypothetical protein